MATFSNIPIEIIHNIAEHLAPKSCEDSKQGISTFRLLERRTWLVGNRYAFKYMTLHVRNISDLSKETKLGKFGSQTRPDLNGFDVRNSVQQVCYMAWLPQLDWHFMHSMMESAERTFKRGLRKHIFGAFNPVERIAWEHYQKLLVEPYIPCVENAKEFDQRLTNRIRSDLVHFPNIRTMKVDVDSHFLDSYNDSYRYLEDINLLERFWKDARFTTVETDTFIVRGGTHYKKDMTFASNFLRSIPSIITKLIWPGIQLDKVVILDNKSVTWHITELESTPNPHGWGRAQEQAKSLSVFPRTRTLRLSSNAVYDENLYEIFESHSSSNFLCFLPTYVRFLALPELEKIYIKTYAIGQRELGYLLQCSARNKWELHLENMTLVRTPARFNENTANTSWLHVLQVARSNLMGYVSSGLVHLDGEFKSFNIHDKGCAVWRQELRKEVVKMLEGYLHTGVGEQALVAELSTGASCGVRVERTDWELGTGPEHEEWQDLGN